jgi:toxin secretion/phage lysis holin
MDKEIIQALSSVRDSRTLFIICSILIFSDVLTGYLKAFRNKKINSSISRDGYIKKVGWIVALILGVLLDYFIHVHIFLFGTAIVCITTEAISVYENLSDIGVKLPFAKYFEKVKDSVDGEER